MTVIYTDPNSAPHAYFVVLDDTGEITQYGHMPRPSGDPRLHYEYETMAALLAEYPELQEADTKAAAFEAFSDQFANVELGEVYRVKLEQAARIRAELAAGTPEADIDVPLLRREAQLRGLTLAEMADAVFTASALEPDEEAAELARVAAKIALPVPAPSPPAQPLRDEAAVPVDDTAEPEQDVVGFTAHAFNRAPAPFTVHPFNRP